MGTLRPFVLVDGGDAWLRAGHRDTFLELEAGVVTLAWEPPAAAEPGGAPPPRPGGLAFDRACRAYRALPDEGRVLRHPWGGYTAGAAEGTDLFAAAAEGPGGDFAAEAAPGVLRRPAALAVDVDDRLYVAEEGRARLLVFDLWSRRLLRAAAFDSGARPLDVAAAGRSAWVVLDAAPRLVRLTARGLPRPVPLPPDAIAPERVALSPSGEPAVLVGAGTDAALLVSLVRPNRPVRAPGATDLEWESDDVLVAARGAGPELERFRLSVDGVERMAPLLAWGYDGRGIARGPEGRIAFWSAAGLRAGAPARLRYARRGRVTTFRLDGGEYGAEWGRVFLDACVPAGAEVRLACLATDDCVPNDPPGPGECVPPDATLLQPTLLRPRPGNLLLAEIHRPDLSPPMPPEALAAAEPAFRPLHRRESGRELAWARPAEDDRFATYEAPAAVGPGRFLWVVLELAGNGRVTPGVRSLRVERPGHDLLRRLPRTFSREAESADFLRRLLAITDSLTSDLESRAAFRHALLDPHAAPEDALPWLASFLGMALDGRWPVHARRRLVAEAAWLFRFRGTVPGLTRFLELYLERPVVLLEHFRLRGMGAAVLHEGAPAQSRPVLGGGFRVGGALRVPGEPADRTPPDAFRLHAHRFSLLVHGSLSAEQESVVRHVLEVHRPAHTVVEICPLGAGMRVGRRLHLGLSSAVGRTGGWDTLEVGGSALGRGAVVGRPEAGTEPGAARLGLDARVG